MAAKNESAADPTFRTVVLTRLLDAPRELVFKMWTDPEARGAVVGAEGLYEPRLRSGRPAGRRPPHRHARAGRGRVSDAGRLPRGRRAGAARLHQRGAGPRGQARAAGRADRHLRRRRRQDPAHRAAEGHGPGPVRDPVPAGDGGGLDAEPGAAGGAGVATPTGRSSRRASSTAPRELVFQAWTEPEHLREWWGPKGFTNTFHEFDPAAGRRLAVRHARPRRHELQKRERFYRDSAAGADRVGTTFPEPNFRLTAVFEDVGGKTRLTWHMLFTSAADRDKIKGVAVEGNRQNLERWRRSWRRWR